MEITLPETAEQAVAKGAEALDRIRPGWAEQVDPALLNMANSTLCVISQVWKHDYIDVELDVAALLDSSTLDDSEVALVMMAHGFYRSAGTPWSYANLDHEWRAEVQHRTSEPAEVV